MPNFRLIKILEEKRNGNELSNEDIEYFVNSVVKSTLKDVESDEVADRSQIGAMLMAIYFKGLNSRETSVLIQKMKNSGYIFSWPETWSDLVVDKHSTGGVGDKVSLILAPALAALGLKVPMISGRSLGHTGGTLDKLESIPGFRIYLPKEEIYSIIKSVGCCIVGQTDDCVPADKILYHCRDITATVDCPPLIIASIVSKKLSVSPSTLVYDVKYGKGSVFKSKEEALYTARELVKASKDVNSSAILTSMENPLGKSIGNSLEMLEALECLQGRGPQDVLEVTYALGSEILRHARKTSIEEGEMLISSVLKNGQALAKFHDMLICQGVSENIASVICYGNADSILSKELHTTDIHHIGSEGYIKEIDPLVLAKWWKEEYSLSFCHFIGITLLKSVEDRIQPGDAWARVYHNSSQLTDEVICKLQHAIYVDSHKYRRTVVCQKIQ